jgi:hypothetical protein
MFVVLINKMQYIANYISHEICIFNNSSSNINNFKECVSIYYSYGITMMSWLPWTRWNPPENILLDQYASAKKHRNTGLYRHIYNIYYSDLETLRTCNVCFHESSLSRLSEYFVVTDLKSCPYVNANFISQKFRIPIKTY